MARKNDLGKFILSAGEIGAYTVCPEAWRLKAIDKVRGMHVESVTRGRELHEKWARDYDEALFLARNVKLMVLLIALAAVIYIILQGGLGIG
jgi:hypothetical protein